MKVIKKILFFIAVNLLGFYAGTILLLLAAYSGLFTALDDAQATALRDELIRGTSLTWLACAVFSLSYFFLKKREGLIFLWAAAVIPLLYGLSALVL